MVDIPRQRAERTAVIVGVASGLIGAALAVAPDSLGRATGFTHPLQARAVAALDLVIAAGLLTGRPRWPWLAVRASSNLPIAALAVVTADTEEQRRRAVIFGSAIAVATVGDAVAAHALRRAGV